MEEVRQQLILTDPRRFRAEKVGRTEAAKTVQSAGRWDGQ